MEAFFADPSIRGVCLGVQFCLGSLDMPVNERRCKKSDILCDASEISMDNYLDPLQKEDWMHVVPEPEVMGKEFSVTESCTTDLSQDDWMPTLFLKIFRVFAFRDCSNHCRPQSIRQHH